MYSKINELLHKGFSERKTAKILGVNRGTVKKYKEMSLDEYRDKATTIRKLSKMEEYKPIRLDWLREFEHSLRILSLFGFLMFPSTILIFWKRNVQDGVCLTVRWHEPAIFFSG